MTSTIAIHCHDIPDLVAAYSGGNRLGRLMDTVAARFGRMATFHTGSAAGMDLDALLRFLKAREKVRITGGMVYPGGAPACGN